MAFRIAVALCALIAVAAAIPAGAPGWGPPGAGAWGPPGWGAAGPGGAGAGAVNPWIPPWISAAPWYPQWAPCTTVGSSCVDCNTKIVCTKVGGLQRACTDPTLPHCNLGECSATPSAECAPPAATA